jgi:uncharacterized protein (TIGR02246 family)
VIAVSAGRDAAEEVRIRAMVDAWTEAVRSGDIDARVADYAPDVLSFDAVDPLQRVGSPAVRERLAAWLSSYDGPVDYSPRDVAVTAASDVAFVHCLNHIRGTRSAGGDVDMWVRTTTCLRKLHGRWLIVHEHTSSPFDPQTGLASVGLQP